MRKISLLLSITILTYICKAQTCTVNLSFSTQTSIDNFAGNNPGCATINGNITISGNDITNLAGLSSITSVNGFLRINSNPLLTSVSGLPGVTSVGGEINIESNPVLSSLSGLDNLASIGSSLRIVFNSGLNSISALSKIKLVNGFLSIGGNPALTTLAGMEGITSITGALALGANISLSNVNGLSSLTTIGGYTYIVGNKALANLAGLAKVTSVAGYLNVSQNNVLNSLSGLVNLTHIGGELNVSQNNALASLSGIDNINPTSITYLKLQSSTTLSFCGVSSILTYLTNNGGSLIGGNAVGCRCREEILSGACTSLPVDLVRFDGENTTEGNKLTWKTTSETNNQGFEIERSSDAKSFVSIGYLKGNGDSNQSRDYAFIDLLPDAITYYRLKQIDFDQSFSYSRIITVKRRAESSKVKVYPNPSDRQLFIEADNKAQEFRLFTSQGAVVKQAQAIPAKGLDTSSLQSGLYILTIGENTFKVLVSH